MGLKFIGEERGGKKYNRSFKCFRFFIKVAIYSFIYLLITFY